MQKITPCLWFDGQAEEAAQFYTKIFKRSKILSVSRYGEGAPFPKGTALVVVLRIEGQTFQALNGGPQYKFTPAISLSVDCKDQKEVDRLWDQLRDPVYPGQCGWLVDRYGVSWQIVPRVLVKLLGSKDRAKSGRVMQAMMKMGKIDVATLERAAAGK